MIDARVGARGAGALAMAALVVVATALAVPADTVHAKKKSKTSTTGALLTYCHFKHHTFQRYISAKDNSASAKKKNNVPLTTPPTTIDGNTCVEGLRA